MFALSAQMFTSASVSLPNPLFRGAEIRVPWLVVTPWREWRPLRVRFLALALTKSFGEESDKAIYPLMLQEDSIRFWEDDDRQGPLKIEADERVSAVLTQFLRDANSNPAFVKWKHTEGRKLLQRWGVNETVLERVMNTENTTVTPSDIRNWVPPNERERLLYHDTLPDERYRNVRAAWRPPRPPQEGLRVPVYGECELSAFGFLMLMASYLTMQLLLRMCLTGTLSRRHGKLGDVRPCALWLRRVAQMICSGRRTLFLVREKQQAKMTTYVSCSGTRKAGP
jgi:hypothetical protein